MICDAQPSWGNIVRWGAPTGAPSPNLLIAEMHSKLWIKISTIKYSNKTATIKILTPCYTFISLLLGKVEVDGFEDLAHNW